MKVYIEYLTLNLMLPNGVLIDVATRNFEIHRLFYYDVLHTNSPFMTPRKPLEGLDQQF